MQCHKPQSERLIEDFRYITLCAVGDAMELTKALDRYEDIDYTFSGSREGKLLRVCLFNISKNFLC